MDKSKRACLFSLAACAKRVAGLARPLARGERTWSYWDRESWGDGYNRVFDEFEGALKEFESVRNSDNLPLVRPDRTKAQGLLDSTTDSVAANLAAILDLYDQIEDNTGCDNLFFSSSNGWDIVPGPGFVRVLQVGRDLPTRLRDAAVSLERDLLRTGIEDRQCASPSPVSGRPGLNLEDLGIGFDEQGYWAFSPCPGTGEVVRKESGLPLPLPGDRWQEVLQCFADSPDGRTVRKADLITALKVMPQGSVPLEHVQPDGLKQMAGPARRDLSSTLADLGRILRATLHVTGRLTVFDGRKEGDLYHALFTCRALLLGQDGQYRFGQLRG
jgi:hypothetical protein